MRCLSIFAVAPPATVDVFLLTATTNAITELLASATLEEATIGRSELRADDGFQALPKLRKTFDHYLLFRALCSTSSGYNSESDHLTAGLNEVEDATTIWQFKQWLNLHGEKVRISQLSSFSTDCTRKIEILLPSFPLPSILYALSTNPHMMNATAARTSK